MKVGCFETSQIENRLSSRLSLHLCLQKDPGNGSGIDMNKPRLPIFEHRLCQQNDCRSRSLATKQMV